MDEFLQEGAMKSLAIAALLLASAAWGVTYDMPKLFPQSCGGVQVAYDLASGRVWEHTQCSTGGRGTRPRQITACADVVWNEDGTVESSQTLWLANEIGTSYPHAEACL